jgi:hypothetical protein
VPTHPDIPVAISQTFPHGLLDWPGETPGHWPARNAHAGGDTEVRTKTVIAAFLLAAATTLLPVLGRAAAGAVVLLIVVSTPKSLPGNRSQ